MYWNNHALRRLACLLLTATALWLGGCSARKDSTKVAEATNDSLIEQVRPDQESRLPADSKANAKDVAEFMGTVANASQTARTLSELALKRTTDPTIKALAQRSVDQERRHKASLDSVARTYAIVLPQTLSTDSESMVNALRDEKAGADFDKRYLRYLADLYDQLVSKTKNLNQNSSSPTVKNLALSISAHADDLMTEAEKTKKQE
ncbi:DUF4142 domain-containing protein [Spirosoma sordidisoli]|uniref:DUF4142 domain-containing protein n=1 Tax=Spirosoma sordidisoli TaxID=2502893 RepID=A0A4Q2UC11_9BACT|nr:DUF4142 domain-containing protein [Spirosoma sordidisoli]RYC66276.1 DUF4142 domain-containing protein [Spirosoma sordidisoli]